MKKTVAAFVALACVVAVLLQTSGSAQQRAVSIPVIVVFEEATDFVPFAASYRADDRAEANPAAWNYQDRGVAGFVQELERGRGFRADFVYSRALRGFAARLSAQQIADLENDPRVAYVELDGLMSIDQGRGKPGGGGGGGSTGEQIPWGITKIGAAGKASINNVRAYIIDTGIDTEHGDLTVTAHVNFAGGKNLDCHGHGTHVAGTVAAKNNDQDVVGVAPGAPLIGVKVLNCQGSGTTSGVIAGIDWVTANAIKPAIANMSLGGGASSSLDTAVINSATSGVFYSIAAGNSGASACNSSPARAGTTDGVMTTAATDSNDNEASWSNYGNCVDIWAPGVGVLSTRRGGGTTTMSGTSMAAPHVGGGGTRYLALNSGASAGAVESAIRSAAQGTGTNSKDGGAISRLYVGGF